MNNEKDDRPNAHPMVCPNCGKPQMKDLPSFVKPGECRYCGIIFNKVQPDGGQNQKMSSATEKTRCILQGAPTASGDHPPKTNIIARHKGVAVLVFIVVTALVAFPLIQMKYKKDYLDAASVFDRRLKMETKDDFEKSLENVKILIEETAILVNKRGWSESNVNDFYQQTKDRLNRFLDMMDQKAGDQGGLWGFKTADVQRDLCGGMHIILLLIRDENIRLKMQTRSSLSPVPYSNRYPFTIDIRGGNYLLCNPSEYKGSSLRKVVREGDHWVLKDKSEKEKLSEKNKQMNFGPPYPVKTETEKLADEVYKRVENEISQMQFAYRRKHGGRWCEDLRTLVADHLSVPNATVSEETMDMINGNLIGIKMSREGHSYILVDLRKN